MHTVLVTRPKHQQEHFISQCAALGLNTISLPLLRIEPRDVDPKLSESKLPDPHTAWIFTSRNAVTHCPFKLNPTGPVFAMGSSTARALETSGRQLAAEPDTPFNSEALVAQLVHGNAKSAVVITGVGGRAYLANELKRLNWNVTEVACYERIPVQHTKHTLIDALSQADILSLTSIESMDALIQQTTHVPTEELTSTEWKKKPLIVNSERAVVAAETAGFTGKIIVAVPAGDNGQIDALKALIDK